MLFMFCTVCQPKREVEVAFAVDHTSIGTRNTKHILKFIKRMVSELDPLSPLIKTKLLTQNCPKMRKNNKTTRIASVAEQIDSISFSDIGNLLRDVRIHGWSGRKSMTNKVAIVFLDANVDIPKTAYREAQRNRFKKIETFVIAVGHTMNADLISSKPAREHVITIRDYTDLWRSTDKVLATICRSK